MAFGSEVLLMLGAGFVLLGPKRMQSMIDQIGRAKAQLQRASRNFISEVTDNLDEELRSVPAEEGSVSTTELVLPDEFIERICRNKTAKS
jgi:Sec-independent protein translocase protein TatA